MSRQTHRSIAHLIAVCSLLYWITDAIAQEKKPNTAQGLKISNVAVSALSFNPSRGETVKLSYHLSQSAAVTVKVFDADMELIRVLTEKNPRKPGMHNESWNGKDIDGKIVPNEAYLFTIETEDASGNKAVFDPVTFSGGEGFDISQAQFDRGAGTLTYKLPRPSRVLIRVGIPGSALLKTLADWEPRVQGEITEYWNGKDENNLLDVWKYPKSKTLITGFSLPETSVIAFGNTAYDYPMYKAGLPGGRSKKEQRAFVNQRKLSPRFLSSRLEDRSFKVVLDLQISQAATQAPLEVREKVPVRIDVAEKDRELLTKQKFEIIFFVDMVYVAEEERAYVPFNYAWELGQLPEGEHILTVNFITAKGQMGVGSVKVKVVK